MPGAVDSAARRLFLKRRMATLYEWSPLKQHERPPFFRKKANFVRHFHGLAHSPHQNQRAVALMGGIS
jgi:hypothetical protein